MKPHIILGITGSVAAIKAFDLVVALNKLGEVRVVATQSGEYFLQPQIIQFEKKGIPIYKDSDEWPSNPSYQKNDPILHIQMRRWADCLIVAPLDVNTLAKIANGMCDNLLTTLIRVWDWQCPILVAPAMNTLMWQNKPTSEHINLLKTWGATVIDPVYKQLACGETGMGGMAPIETIFEEVKIALNLN